MPPNVKKIVESMIGKPAQHWYESMRAPAGTTGQVLLEMPQHYPGKIVYQSDQHFTPIAVRNFGDYIILGHDEDYTYAVDPQETTGFAFTQLSIIDQPRTGLIPVLRVSLRDSGIKGYKQAHRLRIRQEHALKGVATNWYTFYVDTVGGIVSDFEHLEGGKRLWRLFVDTALHRGFQVTLMDTHTGEQTVVGADTPDGLIWSLDATKKPVVLIMERS